MSGIVNEWAREQPEPCERKRPWLIVLGGQEQPEITDDEADAVWVDTGSGVEVRRRRRTAR